MHATQRKIFGLVVDIDGATYPIGDATERVIAQAALLRAGLVETPVYDVGYHSGTWTRTDAMFRLDPGIDIVGHTPAQPTNTPRRSETSCEKRGSILDLSGGIRKRVASRCTATQAKRLGSRL